MAGPDGQVATPLLINHKITVYSTLYLTSHYVCMIVGESLHRHRVFFDKKDPRTALISISRFNTVNTIYN